MRVHYQYFREGLRGLGLGQWRRPDGQEGEAEEKPESGKGGGPERQEEK